MLITMDFGSWGCHYPRFGRVASHVVQYLIKFPPQTTFSVPAYGTCSDEHAELQVDIVELHMLLHQKRIATNEMQELNVEKRKKIGQLEDELGALENHAQGPPNSTCQVEFSTCRGKSNPRT